MSHAGTECSGKLEHRFTTNTLVCGASQELDGRFRAVRQALTALRRQHLDETHSLDATARTASEQRQKLDAVLLDSLRPFVLGSGVLITVACVYLGVVLDSLLGLAGVALGLVIGATFLKIYRMLRTGRVSTRFAHPLAASVSLAGYVLLAFGLISDKHSPADLRFMALALTVVTAGALYLTLRWLLGMMTIMFSAWIAINLAIGFEFDWGRHLAGLLFIGLTTLMGYAVRKRAIVKMIAAQQENERQNAQLIEALERAHRSEAELHVERHLADQIVDTMGQGLVLLDGDGAIEYTNNAAEEIFGRSTEELDGIPAGAVFRSDSGELAERFRRLGVPGGAAEETFEVTLEQRGGTESSILISAVSRPGGGAILTLTDLTVRKQFEAQLERLAHYDALTGLANRPHLIQRIEKVVADSGRRSRQIAVLFLDLDRFKHINDTMGHAVGDRVLIACAERIQDCIRSQDTAARFGGDEFVVLLVDIEEAAAVEIAERIVASIEQPFILADSIHTLSGSIGISIGDARAIEPEEMLRQADTAMYEAKRNRVVSAVVYGSGQRTHVALVA